MATSANMTHPNTPAETTPSRRPSLKVIGSLPRRVRIYQSQWTCRAGSRGNARVLKPHTGGRPRRTTKLALAHTKLARGARSNRRGSGAARGAADRRKCGTSVHLHLVRDAWIEPVA